MSLQRISGYYFFLSTFIVASLLTLCFLRVSVSSGFYGFSMQIGSLFGLDYVSLSFGILSLLLFLCLLPLIISGHVYSCVLLSLSVLFSLLSYICFHSLLFWGFYELSMLFLLVLLVLDSPYSERYVAGWYLLGYVVFTSLPMFLCILWVSSEVGSYNLFDWYNSYLSDSSVVSLILLSVLFMTKIPLVPFHVWLPIVHAEAPSPVSVCLSGYMMKLGVLGLYRFCWSVLPDYIFSPYYSFIVLCAASLFFISSCRELDGKRWLAFLSLAHMGFVCFSICLSSSTGMYLPFYFCLGHGLSAGVTFMLLWLFYNLSSSRNWGVLKASVLSSSVMRVFSMVCLFSAASVPPTMTFFSEVLFLGTSLYDNLLLSLVFSLYLFAGGLVPLFLLGFVLGRGYSVSLGSHSCWSYFTSIFVLLLCIYLLFIVL